jgi:Ca-dependent carbohydrate-binding module xylan-binding
MRKRKLFVISSIFIFIILLGYILLKPAFKYLSGYLSKSEHVKANILVVEGWLPENALKMAYEEFKKNEYEYIITTGLKTTINYFGLYENGYLIFYSKSRFSGLKEVGNHSIEIDAFSELGGENRAHFNMYLNDSLVANFYAEKSKAKYTFNWKGPLDMIDSIIVQFDNDSWGKFGDRNLYVKDINVDHKITIPYIDNSVYSVFYPSGEKRVKNNFNSNAELARNRLISMGINPSQVIATPGETVIVNRTLTSALAFRDWLKHTKMDITGINIISLGAHARRTWMIYNRILNEKYPIGIISLPDYIYTESRVYRLFKNIRETLGIIYYWIVLIPY